MNSVRFEFVDPACEEAVRALPWHAPLSSWRRRRVRHLAVRRGTGRHAVAFVEVRGVRLVVKELGAEGARREIAVYRELRSRGIETLEPAAVVVREEEPAWTETAAGSQIEPVLVGHSVTRLAGRVLPDSLLFPLGFARPNRRRILDAVVDLFVDLHAAGVYWGDASTANTLIRFLKVDVPFVGRRTELSAVLADAETVEIRPVLSESLRRADVETFLESMTWLAEDLRRGGILRGGIDVEGDRAYFIAGYERRRALERREREFEARTGLAVRRMLGRVRETAYFDTLERHIEEHKWYLSEGAAREIPLPEAAADWHVRVFEPVCGLFRDESVLALFPGRTASELYVEVMTHKYLVSEKEGRDVGMTAALRDYAERFGRSAGPASLWTRIASGLASILGFRERRDPGEE